MKKRNLFDYDYSRDWPEQSKFPINEDTVGRTVQSVLIKDIEDSKEFIIVTGFTSLSNMIKTFGLQDSPILEKIKIVIGYEPDERVSKRLPHYSLSTEIKNYWLKQNISILHCGPILNIIEQIKSKKIEFRAIDKLHSKIYVGDNAAILGSSNFSISGIIKQRESNIRVVKNADSKELYQYNSIKQLANNYFDLAQDYNSDIIDLLSKLLKDADWQEALARAIAEILESKWINDYPILYKAIVSNELWPSQKIGIARALKIIQDQGNLLIADPTGSGKTKFATALAYTTFHWLWENGLKDSSNALIISPKQVVENWEKEQTHFKIFNKIESMGRLSIGTDKNKKEIGKAINTTDILIIDEAHNYLSSKTNRSKSITNRRGATHVILATATPINRRAEDLLRLIELLDIDNLSDDDLNEYFELRKQRNHGIERKQMEKLKGYINQFIVRRTKKELNRMIDREPELYKNSNGNYCRYPETKTEIYSLNETELDKQLAKEINEWASSLKGVNYLQRLVFPRYIITDDDKINYLKQRFSSAPALAHFKVKSSLRSSKCALFEYIYGTDAANAQFDISSPKSKTGNIIASIEKLKEKTPKITFPKEWLSSDNQWILNDEEYKKACDNEIDVYKQIASRCLRISDKREEEKAKLLVQKSNESLKVIGFDSTVITLDYLRKFISNETTNAEIIVATGASESSKKKVRESFDNANLQKQEKIIALCSDAMSESINLPAAKVMVLLDMPSVLRIIEQRIGRLERMDSEHKEIFVFWPDDAEEFSLKGDKRIIDILAMTENLIGSNVEIPQQGIYKKYYAAGLGTKDIIKAYENYAENDEEWEGVKDSTQSLFGLIEGKNALITQKIYNEFKDVDATVKTAISFIESDLNWSFFAFRGDSRRSPKWLLILTNVKNYSWGSEGYQVQFHLVLCQI